MSSTPSRWKQVPFAASVFVVCGLLVCGAIYLVSYRERDAYLASRNFRLLAVLAQQTEAAIKAQFHTAMAARGATDSQSRAVLDVNPGRGDDSRLGGPGEPQGPRCRSWRRSSRPSSSRAPTTPSPWPCPTAGSRSSSASVNGSSAA